MELLVIASALLALASAQHSLADPYAQGPGTFAYRTPYSYSFLGVGNGASPTHANNLVGQNGLGAAGLAHGGLPGGHAGLAGAHAGFPGAHAAFSGAPVGHAAAHGGNVHGGVAHTHAGIGRGHAHAEAAHAAAVPQANLAFHGGILQDTPEVQAAKAAHFKAFNEAAARAAASPDPAIHGHDAHDGHALAHRGPAHPHGGHPVAHGAHDIAHRGHAAAHGGFPAHAGFAGRGAHPGHNVHAGPAAHNVHGAHNVRAGHNPHASFAPVVTATNLGHAGAFPTLYNGAHRSAIPLQVQDTPEVAAAKAAHFKAHQRAQALAGPSPHQ